MQVSSLSFFKKLMPYEQIQASRDAESGGVEICDVALEPEKCDSAGAALRAQQKIVRATKSRHDDEFLDDPDILAAIDDSVGEQSSLDSPSRCGLSFFGRRTSVLPISSSVSASSRAGGGMGARSRDCSTEEKQQPESDSDQLNESMRERERRMTSRLRGEEHAAEILEDSQDADILAAIDRAIYSEVPIDSLGRR